MKIKIEDEVMINDEIKNKVYEVVKDAKLGTYLADIVRKTNINRLTARKALLVLKSEGKVEIERRGNMFYVYAKGGEQIGREKT